MPRPSVEQHRAGIYVAVADVVEERADDGIAHAANHVEIGRDEHQRAGPPALVGEGEDHDRRGEHNRCVKSQPAARLAGREGGFSEPKVRAGYHDSWFIESIAH